MYDVTMVVPGRSRRARSDHHSQQKLDRFLSKVQRRLSNGYMCGVEIKKKKRKIVARCDFVREDVKMVMQSMAVATIAKEMNGGPMNACAVYVWGVRCYLFT